MLDPLIKTIPIGYTLQDTEEELNKFVDLFREAVYKWSGFHVVFNAPENSKTERGGLNFGDPEK